MKNSFILKRTVTYLVALAIAVLASYYFARSEKYWLILTALFVMHTTIGVTLRQGLQRYLLAILIVAVGTEVAFMLFPAMPMSSLYTRLYDVTLGAIIGIAVNLLIFPVKLDVEFRNSLIPLLQSYNTYLSSITNLLINKNVAQEANKARYQVEENLQTQSAFFPEWVYEKGLSPSLQPGYRHFLIMTERVGQILFSMHYLAEHVYQQELLNELKAPLMHYTKHVEKIFQTLITILLLKIPEELISDLSEELDALQIAFEKVAPLSIELLDVSPDYIRLAAWIENLRDLRVTLIQLGRSVRFEKKPLSEVSAY